MPTSGTTTSFYKGLSGSGSGANYSIYPDLLSITPPGVKNEVKKYVSSSTSGVEKSYPSKIIKWGEVKTEFVSSTCVAGILTDLNSSGSSWYKVSFPDSTVMYFDGYVTSYTPKDVDQESGEMLTTEATFQPLGTVIIA